MRVSVFGLGYVGAVSCACLSERGHHIIGVDTNPAKVDMINKGQSPVVEDRIDDLIAAGVAAGRLRAVMDGALAVAETEMTLVSVATPSNLDFSPNLDAVDKVIRAIGEAIARKPGHHTVVLRSTVPPGTTESRIQPILEEAAGRKVGDRLSLVFNPEFLREGSSVKDFHNPPQTVIGSLDDAGFDAVAALYDGLPGAMVRTSCRVAESVTLVTAPVHAPPVPSGRNVTVSGRHKRGQTSGKNRAPTSGKRPPPLAETREPRRVVASALRPSIAGWIHERSKRVETLLQRRPRPTGTPAPTTMIPTSTWRTRCPRPGPIQP